MNVLVVDDELPIRTWIAASLEKIKELPVTVVGIAANGKEALDIFKDKKPDVVLADIKMPVMDGLSLLRKIKEINIHAVVVILTCHDEFSYAREAVSEKAYDYILKTEITPKKLCSLLQKIQTEIQKQSSTEQWIDIQTQQEYGIKQIFQNADHLKKDEIKTILSNNQIRLKEEALFAIAFHKDGYLNEKIKSDAESIQDDRVANLVYYPYDHNINIAIANIENIPSLLYQKNAQYEFARKLAKRYQSQVGVSDLYYNYSKMREMILQSIHTLNLGFYGNVNLHFINSNAKSYAECKADMEQYKLHILTAVDEGQYIAAKQEVEKIYEYLRKTPIYDIELLKQFFLSIITGFLLKIYVEKPQQYIEKMNEYQSALLTTADISQTTQLINNILDQFMNAQHYEKPFYTYHIARAIEYMEQHYCEICSVTEVADYIGLNSDYFSRLIKKETGVTFSQYLTNIRMNQAINLLQNSDLKVYEIADEVGYSNFGYFSKTFKKSFQVTPFEFRNNMRNK